MSNVSLGLPSEKAKHKNAMQLSLSLTERKRVLHYA